MSLPVPCRGLSPQQSAGYASDTRGAGPHTQGRGFTLLALVTISEWNEGIVYIIPGFRDRLCSVTFYRPKRGNIFSKKR